MKNSINRAFEIHILGKNKLNEVLKSQIELIIPQLQKFIGKKIMLATGEHAKIFTVEIPKVEKDPNFSGTFLSPHRNHITQKYGDSLYFCFSICLGEDGVANYFDRDIQLGVVKNGILESVESVEKIISDYKLDLVIDAEAEKAKITEYKRLQKLADTAKSLIKTEADIYKFMD